MPLWHRLAWRDDRQGTDRRIGEHAGLTGHVGHASTAVIVALSRAHGRHDAALIRAGVPDRGR
jgi:hypothetical protein